MIFGATCGAPSLLFEAAGGLAVALAAAPAAAWLACSATLPAPLSGTRFGRSIWFSSFYCDELASVHVDSAAMLRARVLTADLHAAVDLLAAEQHLVLRREAAFGEPLRPRDVGVDARRRRAGDDLPVREAAAVDRGHVAARVLAPPIQLGRFQDHDVAAARRELGRPGGCEC